METYIALNNHQDNPELRERLKIDYRQLILGFTDLFLTLPETYKTAMSLGMLPGPLMENARNYINEKLDPFYPPGSPSVFEKLDEGKPDRQHVLDEIMHNLTVGILKELQDRKILKV